MTFRWPHSPSANASSNEIADYAEMVCWRNGHVSSTDVIRDMEKLEENDYAGGVGEESEVEVRVGEALVDIRQRERACGDGYPFRWECNGQVLTMDSNGGEGRLVYLYLLLATRLNMKDSRRHASIDGTLLLEHLSAEVARAYFGQRAESYVFGSSNHKSFGDKINDLCVRLKEGGGFRQDESPPGMRDGGLDVVVWKHFADQSPGKMIGFGQCKTGTSYKDRLSELHGDAFCRKWTMNPPAFTPMRMYFVAEALSRDGNWRRDVLDAGLLFDRCRLVDYCGNCCSQVLRRLREWTDAAAIAHNLGPVA